MDLAALTIAPPTPSFPATAPPVRVRSPERFLKGPVPLPWLCAAACLPGKSLHVGVALWHLAGARRSQTIALPNALLEGFGVDRFAKRRALDALEQAGLIHVEHHRGRHPLVSILTASIAAPQP